MADIVDVAVLAAQLYRSAPEDFVSERAAGARRLKDAGQPEDAARFAKLAKPSLSAWAVNLLASSSAPAIDEVVARGDDLRRAHTDGGDPKGIRAAQRARQESIRRATESAAGLVGRQLSDVHREEVGATLEAASVDSAAAEVVRAGQLVRPLEPPTGFGALTGLTLITGGRESGTGRRRAVRDVDGDDGPRRTGRGSVLDVDGPARSTILATEAETATTAAEAAGATAADLDRGVSELEDQRQRLDDELRTVDGQLATARREARHARRAADQAAERAERARRRAGHGDRSC